MAQTPPDPAAGRIPVLTYATPDIRDVVFYVNVNSTLPDYEEPAYGDPYDGVIDTKEKFPSHKLTFVSKADESGWVRWYFCADREDQGMYNLTHMDPDAEEKGFERYTRTYVIPRSELEVKFAGGDVADMPWTPEQLAILLHAQMGEADPHIAFHPFLTGYVLTASDIKELDEAEPRSLYLVVELTFEKLFPVRSRVYNPWFGETVETITTTKLHDEVGFDVLGPNGHPIEFRDLNNTWSQEIERPDFEKAKIGTTLTGEGYDEASCKAFTKTVKYVAAGTLESGVDPITGIVTTTTPVNKVMSVVETKPSTPNLLLGVPISGSTYDPNSGTVKPVTTTYIKTSDVPVGFGGDLDANGDLVEYRPVSPCISKKIERNVKPFNDVTYNTVVNYSFPRVLNDIIIKSWDLLLGGSKTYVSFDWKRNAYSGPCAALVEEVWTLAPPATPPTPIGMSTTSVQYACPLFSLNTGPCLAPAVTISVTTSNRDPNLKFATDSYTSTASALTDWPASFVAEESVRPLAGGWVHKKVTVYPPL